MKCNCGVTILCCWGVGQEMQNVKCKGCGTTHLIQQEICVPSGLEAWVDERCKERALYGCTPEWNLASGLGEINGFKEAFHMAIKLGLSATGIKIMHEHIGKAGKTSEYQSWGRNL